MRHTDRLPTTRRPFRSTFRRGGARRLWPLFAAFLVLGCGGGPTPQGDSTQGRADAPENTRKMTTDPHSYARPHEIAISHLDLSLDVDFETRKLQGRASLTLDRRGEASRLHLDTRDLEIHRVSLDDADAEAAFTLGEERPYLGRELAVEVGPETRVVHVEYSTSPAAAAVQWLEPNQTAGGEHPFLFTQSQAILARTWVPCQDTPAVRMTYSAEVRVPPALMAVMSAEGASERNETGVYTFEMPQRIPSYLLALAVGDLEFRAMGERTGVFAEPSVVEKAAWEFAETEDMMVAVEALYGPYLWGRYDILVLPPAFPFGGMENPRLTFATPTILAGDRSLVALIAHELAHSWSGNLVTNATWDDFWLNEGFTVYLERRIMEAIAGKDYADMLAILGQQDLRGTIEDLGWDSADTHLFLDLEGRDPDDGMTDVAYEKGYFFLRAMEEVVGRERFDPFLRDYFDANAFRSMTTEDFFAHLRSELVAGDAELAEKLRIDEWIYGPGLPANVSEVSSEAFEKVDAQLAAWTGGQPAAELAADGWTTHEWLHFLRGLPAELSNEQMADLDSAFGFSSSGNSEVLSAWLLNAISNGYEAANPALEAFLHGMGRRKFLAPLYRRMAETEDGLAKARRIYAEARPSYHSVSTTTLDEILGWEG